MRTSVLAVGLVVLAALPSMVCVACAQELSAWTIYLPFDLEDECGIPVSPPRSERSAKTGRSEVRLVHDGEPGWGRPIPLDLQGEWVLFRHVLVLSDTLGFFAVAGDTMWSERDHDQILYHRSRFVTFADTVGAFRQLPYAAASPAWAPGLPWVAFCRLRAASAPGIPFRSVYPIVPESVMVWDVTTDRHRSFPIPSRDVAWLGTEDLLVDFGDSPTYRLGIGRAGLNAARFARPGVSPSPNGGHIHDRPAAGQVTVWSRDGQSVTSVQIVRHLGKGKADVRGQPFWVRDPVRGALLCFGLRWRDRVHRDGKKKPDPKACEVIVYDADRGEVVTRLPGGFIGPAAGRGGVFVFRSGRFVYEPLTGDDSGR